MSYWVYLKDDNGSVDVEQFTDGGTYAVGGETVAELNVTYNYNSVYGLLGFNLRELNGKTAAETESTLDMLVKKLGTANDSKDYWAPTPGNAGKALNRLLEWARQHPKAVWRVS